MNVKVPKTISNVQCKSVTLKSIKRKNVECDRKEYQKFIFLFLVVIVYFFSYLFHKAYFPPFFCILFFVLLLNSSLYLFNSDPKNLFSLTYCYLIGMIWKSIREFKKYVKINLNCFMKLYKAKLSIYNPNTIMFWNKKWSNMNWISTPNTLLLTSSIAGFQITSSQSKFHQGSSI